MKNSFKLTLIFLLGIFFYTNAQVTVGGGVNVNIDIPIPDVVIAKRRPTPRTIPAPRPTPRPIPAPRPTPRRNPHTCNNSCNNNCNYNHNNRGIGSISNQNTSNGNFNYQVVNASIQNDRQGGERVSYALNNGETLELIIYTNNPNDYNYHYNQYHNNPHNNNIVAILLNGQEIPVRDASISVQPQGNRGIHSVLNLHTMYDGDFNGTVNF